ncbi:MAG: prepilin peptidase [Alphaproteobacteria bacterium]|nr:prepilin peptidase [Alphaproteobacteria bacterium]MCB9793836.1 prepilin peptidase [Alphaproteobacteria bacterium]
MLLLAAGWDLATRRIPNPLVLVGLMLGLATGLQAGGAAGLGWGLLGAGLAFALTFPQWALKWMGGGDAKLFMVVGAFLGPLALLDVLLLSTAANGLLALGMMALRFAGRALQRELITDARLPMAVAIFMGFAVARAYPILAA